jgi:UDP-2,3-diacylglucosamine hydrolase
MSDTEPIGLLAGWGRFPIAFALKAREVGRKVVCVGVSNEADPALADMVDRFYWAGPTRMGRMIRSFRREGVRRIVMAGKIHKAEMLYAPWRWLRYVPDLRTVWWWFFRKPRENRDDSLLLSIIDEFARDGLTFESALDLCPELLVRPGVLTSRRPTAREEADIAFGWDIARKMGELDIGQSVSVAQLAVLAVEAAEGTDRSILRAGELCRAGGFVVVKVAKPNQDRRFDVPTVGTSTIETLHRAGGRVLAIEAEQTILLDPDVTIPLADRYGLTIVARSA